jgi:ferredoxin
MSNLILSIVVTLIILGGPLTLYAVIKIINLIFGGLKVKFGSVEGNDNLHLLVAWDNESFDDIQVSRAKIEFTELSANGRSKVFSFTFEDNKAKKKSFVIPMNLTSELKACFLDKGENSKAFDNSFFMIEIETVAGETQQFKFSKAKVQKQINEKLSLDKEIEVIPLTEPDQWSVLTRVFPWRKILPQKEEAATPKEAAAKGPAAANAPRAPVDFKVTKVWIEPGCIVCDACENEAPSVFWVKEDTCIVRENAPLDDAAAIKAAADGCPVNVIKFDTVSAKAVG